MIYNKAAKIENFTFDLGNENQFVCVRKVANKNWPGGMDKFCKSRPYICLTDNERGMIAVFFGKLQVIVVLHSK